MVLQKIINQASKQKDYDSIKLPRWIRCLFQLSLTFDENISLKCVDQATQLAAAKHGVSESTVDVMQAEVSIINTPPPTSPPLLPNADVEAKGTNHYPAEELEWLANVAWNHAVDHFAQQREELFKKWAEKVINLAQWQNDEGKLQKFFMETYSDLTWED